MSSSYKQIKSKLPSEEKKELDLVNRVFSAIEDDNYPLFSGALKNIRSVSDLSSENSDGWSPLMRAVCFKRKQMVYDLLARGCNPYRQSSVDGWNSIMCAVDVQDDEIMNELLKRGRKLEDLARKTKKTGSTALSLASSRINLNIVKALLKAGANVDEVSGTNYTKTAIITASSKGRLDNVKEILKYKPNLNFSMGGRGSGTTPLMAAVTSGNFEIVELLLQQDTIDINLKTESGEDALQCAIDNLNSQIIVLLIASGAKLSNKSQVDEHFKVRGHEIYRLTWGRIPPVPIWGRIPPVPMDSLELL